MRPQDSSEPYPVQPRRRGGLLGHAPGGTVLRLVLGCLVVGAIMQGLGLTPDALLALTVEALGGVVEAIQAVIGSGREAVFTLLRWLVYGAVVVVPLYLLSRLRG